MNWKELETREVEELIAWAEPQAWCQAMAHCQQDAQWHAEGDVWTHTQRVLRELSQLDEWSRLTPSEQSLLRFTALLHDVAKPLTTEVDLETGRVTSPKHAVKGEGVARQLLRSWGCDLVTRERICALVRYHGRPVFLFDRDNPTHEVVRLSWLLDNRLLYLFALADNRGRDTDSMNRPEENLHLFKLQALEAQCFGEPFPFATDHARYTFFHQAEPNLHYVPHEDFACSVTLVAGVPGSGKDTWLRTNRPALPVVSLDELRAEHEIDASENQGPIAQLAKERCRELLRAGHDFALNATNTMRLTRGRWLDLFHDYRARIEIIYIEPPAAKILEQNQGRSAVVPRGVIEHLLDRVEPPTPLEAHRVVLTEGSSPSKR